MEVIWKVALIQSALSLSSLLILGINVKIHSVSCLWGQVSHVLRGDSENQGHCHYIACLKDTSTPFSTFVYDKEVNR